MTQVADRVAPRISPPSPRAGAGRAGRWPVVLVMIIALVCCGLCGAWASNWKQEHGGPESADAGRGTLGDMNSYSLALMLGGLRGPLVMVLWSKVENQKIDRDLEDVDTMIEWIRLLQPEFDTVHIFQIWNKAYNISAMMVSTADKYATILDAVDYARRVEAEKPGDLNILDQLARVFGEKLGGPNVQERAFYRKQFMEDTLTDESRRKAYPEDDRTYRRMGVKFFDNKNGPLLTDTNMLDPRLLVQHFPKPAAAKEWNTGAELQYLQQYQPFPLGIPAIGMGYNYAKRAQVAMTVGGQKPLQLSDTVIDTYPAILLREWAQFEQDRAVGYEGLAFGLGGDGKPIAGPAAAAASPLSAPVRNARDLQDAIYGYGMAARTAADSLAEYHRHLASPQYVNPYTSYISTLADLEAQKSLTQADQDYASCFVSGANRVALLSHARPLYQDALTRLERIMLTYYVEYPLRAKLFGAGNVDVEKLPPPLVDQIYRTYLSMVATLRPVDREFEDQRGEYGALIQRAVIRLQQIAAGEPGSFLKLQ